VKVDWADARLYRSATMDRKALIFLHIPKTAGTTLNRIIEGQYSPFEIFTMDPYRIRATPERLKRLPEGRRRRLRMVRGHMFYGVHECLPQGATYFTMLRDPVARALSTYYFILRRPLNPLHRKVKRERLGIEDCIRLFPQRHNLQCRLIAGVKDTAIPDERLLDMAKEHLIKSFSVVGVSERFEESLMLMATTFDWEIPFYKNCKVSKTRPQINSGTVEMIRDHNRLDVELYEFSKGLFEESLQKKEAAVREGLAALHALPAPGALEGFCRSSLGAGRFVVNKIASAV
jgi:Sulfotransferase family